ncbi:hypothetical protein BJV74DRAFT_806971 [Russula compacta]|nr:hypothetical protein BJV74DRAFT_806971 [Russula compacta]
MTLESTALQWLTRSQTFCIPHSSLSNLHLCDLGNSRLGNSHRYRVPSNNPPQSEDELPVNARPYWTTEMKPI